MHFLEGLNGIFPVHSPLGALKGKPTTPNAQTEAHFFLIQRKEAKLQKRKEASLLLHKE